jgi:hypothetical protein
MQSASSESRKTYLLPVILLLVQLIWMDFITLNYSPVSISMFIDDGQNSRSRTYTANLLNAEDSEEDNLFSDKQDSKLKKHYSVSTTIQGLKESLQYSL